MAEISNTDDIIDSRDIIARIEQIEADLEQAEDEADRAELADELETLKALAEEGEGASDDWEYGATLVRDSYWREYAEQWFDDVYGGALDGVSDGLSAYVTIDYDAFARDLQMDYYPVEYGGVTYWVR